MKTGKIAFAAVIALVIFFCVPVKADIVGLWRFEEEGADKTAGRVLDQSGKSNNGTTETGFVGYDKPTYITSHDDSNAMLFGYDDVFGAGNAWNDVRVPKSVSLAFVGTTWTMAAWVRCDSTAGDYPSYNHYPKIMSCPNYEITLHSSTDNDANSYFWPWDETYPDWDFNMAPTGSYEGQWKHIAVTYDGNTFKQYIDGAVVFTKNDFSHQFDTTTWDTAYPTYPLKIAAGSSTTDNGYLIGALDDVAIFNECLDASQIATIKNGNFAGPWQPSAVPESDLPGSFLWDYTFVAQYGTVGLIFGQKRPGDANNVAYIPSWNWQMEGDLNDPCYYGLVNAGLWDGNALTVEYAAYTTVGDIIAQPKDGDYGMHLKIHQDTKYNLKTRLGGENAVGNVVGVKFYAVVSNNPTDKTLLADLSQAIADNNTWYTLGTTFTAGAVDNNKEFRAECYINQGSGNPRGTAFGYFDYVRIDVNAFLTCQALQDYGMGLPLASDFVPDCQIDFKDMAYLAEQWGLGDNPEPMASSTELLGNNDFYADLSRCPNAGNSDGGNPAGWQFVPATSDANLAGVWNVSNMGEVHNTAIQPAGGSVAAYIDPNHELQQAVSSPTIVNSQTYYLSAMLGGVSDSYYHTLRIIYEYVDNPTSPTTITEIARQEYVLPERTAWRRFCTVWTADASAAGNYFRVRAAYVPPPPEIALPNGWGLIGDISINTVKPAYWQRANLLTNGDFEDYSNLPEGTLGDGMGYVNLFTYNGWTYFGSYSDPVPYPPGWQVWSALNGTTEWEGGLQCMLWATAPQPAHGRISVWFGVGPVPPERIVNIDQRVTSETIQTGQTYYLDFIGAISAQNFNDGVWIWPSVDPNLVVELYWLAPGINDIYGGGQGTNWDKILTLKKDADNSLGGSGGHWQTAQTSFTADSSLNGRSFFVRAYGDMASYATFEEIYLSKEPPQAVVAYTCAEQKAKFGGMVTDLNGDCNIDLFDLKQFVVEWVSCNDPEGCP